VKDRCHTATGSCHGAIAGSAGSTGSTVSAPSGGGDTAKVLAATPLFSSLDPASLDKLSKACSRRSYDRGHFLSYQGDPGDRIFVIEEGMVKVVLTSERGDEVVLATMGIHETLGELTVLDESPRSASLIAVEPTVVLILSRRALLQVMAEHNTVLDAMLHSLAAIVHHLTDLTGDFVFLDLGGRVAKLLLRLAAAHGVPNPTGHVVLDVRLSQSELATMVGASRPAVNRALQLLALRGWISLEDHVIVLRDLPALRRRAAG
jgi:CRP/FNR family transcriptional regulator, cyclic AMP receptor protein